MFAFFFVFCSREDNDPRVAAPFLCFVLVKTMTQEWQRLTVINKHPRNDRIQFEEATHIYTVDGVASFYLLVFIFLFCVFFLKHL